MPELPRSESILIRKLLVVLPIFFKVFRRIIANAVFFGKKRLCLVPSKTESLAHLAPGNSALSIEFCGYGFQDLARNFALFLQGSNEKLRQFKCYWHNIGRIS